MRYGLLIILGLPLCLAVLLAILGYESKQASACYAKGGRYVILVDGHGQACAKLEIIK